MGFKNVFAQIILSFDLRALAMQSGAAAGIDPGGFLFLVLRMEKIPSEGLMLSDLVVSSLFCRL